MRPRVSGPGLAYDADVRRLVHVIAVLGLPLVFVSPTWAAAPRTAEIVEGRSMADVRLNSFAPLTAAGDRVETGPLAEWGRVRGGSCFEGTNCRWRVTGGGYVDVIRHAGNGHVRTMAVTAPAWRTRHGVGPGSTARALRREYGRRLVPRTTCGLNGFGGVSAGYILNRRWRGERRFTFFELSASQQRVTRVWIGRGRAAPGTTC